MRDARTGLGTDALSYVVVDEQGNMAAVLHTINTVN
jgi:hypothetical protein